MKVLKIIQCFARDSKAFKSGTNEIKSKGWSVHKTGIPQGVQVHSSGTTNPHVKRWTPASKSDPNYAALNELIGKPGSNHWNKADSQKMCNASIGKLADGTVAVVQAMPWNFRAWLSGAYKVGNKVVGNANNDGYIGFEIWEPGFSDANGTKKDAKYLEACLEQAILLTAYWVAKFNIPITSVFDHRELRLQKRASNHGDIHHLKSKGWVWTNITGDMMDYYRQRVLNTIKEGFKVEYSNGSKIIETEYINANGATDPILPEEPKEPDVPSNTIKGEYYVINIAEQLGMQVTPSVDAKQLGQWPKGQILLISETTKDKEWGLVKDYGTWVWLRYTVPYEKNDQVIKKSFKVMTISGQLNYRTGPSIEYPSMGKYKKGIILDIFEVTSDEKWGHIKGNNYWVMLSYTEPYAVDPTPPGQIDPDEPEPSIPEETGDILHEVVSGNTWWNLSKTYTGTPHNHEFIKQYNNGKTLRVGDIIKIPGSLIK